MADTIIDGFFAALGSGGAETSLKLVCARRDIRSPGTAERTDLRAV
jgi:hypothetical protein